MQQQTGEGRKDETEGGRGACARWVAKQESMPLHTRHPLSRGLLPCSLRRAVQADREHVLNISLPHAQPLRHVYSRFRAWHLARRMLCP